MIVKSFQAWCLSHSIFRIGLEMYRALYYLPNKSNRAFGLQCCIESEGTLTLFSKDKLQRSRVCYSQKMVGNSQSSAARISRRYSDGSRRSCPRRDLECQFVNDTEMCCPQNGETASAERTTHRGFLYTRCFVPGIKFFSPFLTLEAAVAKKQYIDIADKAMHIFELAVLSRTFTVPQCSLH